MDIIRYQTSRKNQISTEEEDNEEMTEQIANLSFGALALRRVLMNRN